MTGIADLGEIGKRKKWGYKLNIIGDVVGHYILNGNGGKERERRRNRIGEGGRIREKERRSETLYE